mmetsp:Transcript_30137/g.88139  ORF Transcript_30137/g.88139 Transcript_30137/m.88139 type:complete len:291 (-) Transcript_30137:65-937(-)
MPVGPEFRRRCCSDPDLSLKRIPIKLEVTYTQGHAPLRLIWASPIWSQFALGGDAAAGDISVSFSGVDPIIPDEVAAALSLPSSHSAASAVGTAISSSSAIPPPPSFPSDNALTAFSLASLGSPPQSFGLVISSDGGALGSVSQALSSTSISEGRFAVGTDEPSDESRSQSPPSTAGFSSASCIGDPSIIASTDGDAFSTSAAGVVACSPSVCECSSLLVAADSPVGPLLSSIEDSTETSAATALASSAMPCFSSTKLNRLDSTTRAFTSAPDENNYVQRIWCVLCYDVL